MDAANFCPSPPYALVCGICIIRAPINRHFAVAPGHWNRQGKLSKLRREGGISVIVQHTLDICSWYAIHTNPRQEVRAESNLRAWGIETYLPKIKELSLDRYINKPTWLIKPLFLRYFFARFSFNTFGHKIRYTRGVRDVVGFGEAPVPIDDEIIKLIQSQHDKLGYVKLEENIGPGDDVVVKEGIFKGIHGIFERNASNSDRVMILLKAIQFQVHMIVDRETLRKV
jgi:transcriptional antiterminator RfaH